MAGNRILLPVLSCLLLAACQMEGEEEVIELELDGKVDAIFELPFDLGSGESTPKYGFRISRPDEGVKISIKQDTNVARLVLTARANNETLSNRGQDPSVTVMREGQSTRGTFTLKNNAPNGNRFAEGTIILESADGGGHTGDKPIRIDGDGLLQVKHQGEWRGVCDDGFDQRAARVACRQLGGQLRSFSTGQRGPSSDFWLDDLSCTGSEDSLMECDASPLGSEDCGRDEHVELSCSGGGSGGDFATIKLFQSNYCSSSFIATVRPDDDCDALADSVSTPVWGVEIDGVCHNIADTSFVNACHRYRQTGPVRVFRSNYCSSSWLTSIGQNTDCDSLSGYVQETAWGIEIDGQCHNIKDMSFKDACERFSSQGEVALYQSNFCSSSLVALISPDTDCSMFSGSSDTVWGVRASGSCLNIVDTNIKNACQLYKNE